MGIDIANMSEDELRAELKHHGVELHHKTGAVKLRVVLAEVMAGTYKAAPEDDVAIGDLNVPTPEATAASRKLTKEQRALKLVRVIVSPNDPLMSTYPGLIFTAGSSAVQSGRMVKKFVPFNNDAGWHVPQIILDQIENGQMQKFRPVKLPNGEKGMQAYLAKKFNVQILPPLTRQQLIELAAAQQSRGGV